MKKWVVVFESDDDLLKEGSKITSIVDVVEIPIEGALREFPQRPPFVHYDFETYQTGFAKGCNWILDDLEGIEHGKYDPLGLYDKALSAFKEYAKKGDKNVQPEDKGANISKEKHGEV